MSAAALARIAAGFASAGGPALPLLRGAADAAVIAAFGALLYPAWFAPARIAPLRRWQTRALASALLLTVAFALYQAWLLAGSVAGIGPALADTLFGHVVALRLVLLAASAGLAAAGLRWPAGLAAGLALLSLAGQSHAEAMSTGWSLLLGSDLLHLLAAGIWLGQLPPLLILIRTTDPATAALASRRFSPWGIASVLTLAVTATIQASNLVVSLPGLIGTAYGWVILAKIGLFLALIALAARHRQLLTPALAGPGGGRAQRRLQTSLALETGIGLLVILAAGLLGCLEPAMHLQPLWPFARRLSFEAVSLEPEFLREVLLAGASIAVTLALLLAAFGFRWRLRWFMLPLAALDVALAVPHFDLLLASAYPTYYWTSPTGFSADAILAGQALYRADCAACHGPEGAGNGKLAAALPVPPADLTAAHLWMHTDGELFWWLANGIEAPDGRPAMPGFARSLTEDQRWDLIDFIRARNAGFRWRDDGVWPVPLQAPALDLACADPEQDTLATLRGHVVRLVFGPAQPIADAVTVALDAAAKPAPGLCTADPDAIEAYAILTGHPSGWLRGRTVLIDGAGWLREVRAPDDTATTLHALIANLAANPLAPAAMSHAGMQM